MRPTNRRSPLSLLLAIILTLSPFSLAIDLLEVESLEYCMENSGFQASHFNIVFTPQNHSVAFDIQAVSTISGYIEAEITVTVYGYEAIQTRLDPCTSTVFGKQNGLCPMNPGPLPLDSNYNDISSDVISKVPSIAYAVPDLDGVVGVKVLSKTTGAMLACVNMKLQNGKTVYQKGVGWASAVVAGLALLVSAIVSGLGHSNTATHVAANALSLFGYFQTQALFGMTAVPLPPIVSSWTQNFQWSMGVIHGGFIQNICTWYQQATGGTPSQLLNSLAFTSVNIQKRAYDVANLGWETMRTLPGIIPRATRSASTQVITLSGIQRVGFRAGIEPTNIFMTGYIFFIVFLVFVVLGVTAFRFTLDALIKSGKVKNDKFQEFRNGWTTVLRGILFRMVLIGFPQMLVLCFWELTVRDSAGEVVFAVVTIVTMIGLLCWAGVKVWRLAKRSIALHKNPAYILYSDPVCLHKWGFLYVQFKATAYWFIVPALLFTFTIGLFVAFGQHNGTAQAVGFLVLHTALLIAMSILRPYMDKRTNAFNISIAAVNFISSVFLLFFTNVFGLPGLVVGIMGVVFFVLNAAFALILLIMVLIATAYAIFSKNPDVRYQPMRDDRGSFIKSQSQLNTELDALGATARGEQKLPFKAHELDEDSYSGSSWEERNAAANTTTNMTAKNGAMVSNVATGYSGAGGMYNGSTPSYSRADSRTSDRSFATPNRSQTASPWQRGAGYDR